MMLLIRTEVQRPLAIGCYYHIIRAVDTNTATIFPVELAILEYIVPCRSRNSILTFGRFGIK